MSAPQKVLVVGASRGIGAELAQQFSHIPDHEVIAAVRDTSRVTDAHNIRYITLNQTCSKSVLAAANEVDAVDVLIINAAIGDDEKMLTTSDDRLLAYLDCNVVGPHRLIKAFLPALEKGKAKKIIFISSTSGSLTKQVESCSGFTGPYSVSKGAGNMLIIQFHSELKQRGFCVIAVHPGWVATDMGNLAGDGGIPVNQSVQGLKKLISGLSVQDSGRFFNYNGSSLPW